MIQELERQDASSTRWSQAHWIVFGSSELEDGVLQDDIGLFSLVCLDLIVKIR